MNTANKKLPDFLVIGAGKSGTTAVHSYLGQHPEIFVSKVKEPNFFALEGHDVNQEVYDPEQRFHYPWAVTDLKSYSNLFNDCEHYQICGETSPMYLYAAKAPETIFNYCPEIRLIAILRDPVDRLYSRYMHLARENREPSKSFEDALDRNSIWWRRNDLVQEGFYYTHLSRYYEYFHTRQIKVFLYEDLKNNPVEFIEELYEFLGVSPEFNPVFSSNYNVSGRIKNRYTDLLIGQNSLLKRGVEAAVPGVMQVARKNVRMKRALNKLRRMNLEKPALDPELRRRLIQDVYYEEIENLQAILGRDLSAWFK